MHDHMLLRQYTETVMIKLNWNQHHGLSNKINLCIDLIVPVLFVVLFF